MKTENRKQKAEMGRGSLALFDFCFLLCQFLLCL